MKKLFTFLLALVTSVGMMHAAVDDSGSCGENVTYSFNGTTGALVITGTGPMTEYSSKTNCPWDGYRTSITSVTVTDGVTTISSNSFGQCTSLQSVTIGNDVETIGEFSFNDCGTNFTSLTLGSSVKSVGFAAFLFGTNIAELVLPESLETINDYAFCQLRAITTVTIPSKVTSIGISAFYNCIALTSIYTEATTPPTLGDGVFGNVPTSIPLYVPNGSVAAYTAAAQWNAFDIQGYDPAPGGGSTPANVCGGGLTWELSDGVLTISYDGEGTGEMDDFLIFEDPAPWDSSKESITSVIIPDGVTRIGNYAFAGCTSLTTVTIPNSVTSIGYSAFYGCTGLTSVTIGNSVTSIEAGVFSGCSSLTSVTIGNSVTSIGNYAFLRCTGLTSITIPNSVTSIGEGAFAKCSNLETVTILAESLESYGTNAFDGTAATLTIYVPAGSVDTYKAAENWSAYADKIEAIGSGSTPTLKLIEFQVPASWENDNTPISIADFPDFVATTYEIASALPVTSEPSLVVFDFPGDDEMSVYTKVNGQVSKSSTGTIVRESFFGQPQLHYYYPVLAGDEPEPAGTVWTSLKVGDVIKVGDKIEVPAEGDGSWGINGNVLKNAWGPYTLIRADIYQASDFDDPVVTETEDGAFYVFKAEKDDFYPLSYLGKSGGLVVTMTSDGLVVTAAENKEFTVAVHEKSDTPTAVENVQGNKEQAVKLFRNGQLYIQREGVLYTVQGARVR